MQDIFEQSMKLLSSDVDRYQRLRMSVLFRFLQEISIAHTELLGAGRSKTLDKGALWVVSRMSVRFSRPLYYDEKLVLESWPGQTMHFIFPRYYRISSEDGTVLMNGAGLWTLIDRETRRIVYPKDLDLFIPGADQPDQPELPGALETPTLTESVLRTVRYSDLDLNGHVNNTRYLDWADDLLDSTCHKTLFWKSLQINYTKEIRLDDQVELQSGRNGRKLYVYGSANQAPAFGLQADLEPAENSF